MTTRVPLAWLQLIKHRGRLIAAVAGIAFAVVLVLVELGFDNALYTSITQLYSHLNADLVLVSPFYQCIIARETFPKRRLYQTLMLNQVQSVAPVYIETLQWTNPITRRDRFILVVGFQPRTVAFDLGEVNNHLTQIEDSGNVLFDENSRSEFGPIGTLFREKGTVVTELSRSRVQVVGLFRVGPSFAVSGHVMTSDVNFLRMMPARHLEEIDVGLVKLKPGSNAQAARDSLADMLPDDVLVLTKQGFLDREKTYWSSNLPIGFLFRASLIMGLIVGAVIVYQILYSGVSEQLSEYATLKAIGYTQRHLLNVIMQEAMILSILGFIPGLLLAMGLYRIVRAATSLPVEMTIERAVLVFPLTAVMCAAAGLFAMRKLQSADPANIF